MVTLLDVARRCLETFPRNRCAVTDVATEVDRLAGRGIGLAGRGIGRRRGRWFSSVS